MVYICSEYKRFLSLYGYHSLSSIPWELKGIYVKWNHMTNSLWLSIIHFRGQQAACSIFSIKCYNVLFSPSGSELMLLDCTRSLLHLGWSQFTIDSINFIFGWLNFSFVRQYWNKKLQSYFLSKKAKLWITKYQIAPHCSLRSHGLGFENAVDFWVGLILLDVCLKWM